MSNDYINIDKRGDYWSGLFNALPRQTRDIAIAVEIGHMIRDLRAERADLVRAHNAQLKEIDDQIRRYGTRLFVDFPMPPSSENA